MRTFEYLFDKYISKMPALNAPLTLMAKQSDMENNSGARRTWSDDDINGMKQMRKQGVSLINVAKHFNCGQTSVFRITSGKHFTSKTA